MKTVFIILSSLLTIISAVPYLLNVIKNKTKPKVVTWGVWSLLTFISLVASFVEGQYATAALLLFASLGSLSIAILGWKNGNKKFNILDVLCLIGVLIGIILWSVFDSPVIAVVIMVSIDFIGGIPTTIHCWKSPEEETGSAFFMGFLGALFTVLVLDSWQITSFLFPLFLVANNLNLTLIIFIRKRLLLSKNK